MPDTRSVTHANRERGVALIAAIAGLVLASAIVLGMTSLARVEVLSSANYKHLVQADALTEAGLQRSIEWLSYTYPTYAGTTDITTYNAACYPAVPAGDACTDAGVKLAGIDTSTANFPLSAVQTGFATDLSGQSETIDNWTGTYSIDAEMLRVREVTTGIQPPYTIETSERWRLTGEGTYLGATSRQTMIVERVFQSFFAHAMYGICSVNRLAGSAYTNSYDSSLGAYGGTNLYDVGAGVGSNGQVWTSGTNVSIGGDVTYGPGTGGCPAGSPATVDPTVVNGDIEERPPQTFPALPAFPAASPVNVSCCGGPPGPPLLLVPGNYGVVETTGNGGIALQGGTAASPTVYYFESLAQFGNSSTISVTPPGSNVVINVRGIDIPAATLPAGCTGAGLYIGGTGILSGTPAPPPENVRINYYGTNCLVIQGGAYVSATIYAPDGDARLGGTGDFYGSVVAKTTELYGNMQFHYDLSLQSQMGILHPGKILSYSREKF